MSKKLSVLLILILIAAIAMTGCGAGGNKEAKILRTNNSSEPGSLDPALAQGTHESWVLDHVFEGLMKRTPDGEIVGGMAKEVALAEDGVTYTFTLRDDVKWSNGDPVTAQDFEYAWKHSLDPVTAAYYSYQFFYIKNGEAYNAGKASVEDVGIKVIDDKTLEVVLEQPAPFFLELTAFYALFPVNKKVAEGNPEWSKDPSTYVSNGPFKLTEWVHKSKIVLSKDDNYYDAKNVKLDGIELGILEDENTAWQKYEGGEYDLLLPLPQAVVAQLNADGNKELVIGAELATYYYNFNNDIKPFNNIKVRKALSSAIDRQTIVDKVSQGGQLPAGGVTPFGIPNENNVDFREDVGNLISYDPTNAKALLEEGLAEEGMTLADMNQFSILYNTQEGHKKIAQAIQEMWRNTLGIEVQIENVEFQVKLDREKAGDYSISRAGWIGDYVDPMTFLDLFVTDGPYNDSGFSNAEYDALIKTAKSTADQKVRFDAMRQAEVLLMEQLPVAPIYHYTNPYAQKPYVTGVTKVVNRYPSMIYADIVK
ncbi:MAG: peptide ABC transporter substrate-binding protein [Firmicutes bacterium HGW-Firmicutes-1]|jgi:oligopeptide transport system substrate-binding protein|nr:MAG: peptide ABC transporter substrate-binding protein [Firmicutes bacterium HGW-Firmicutes-1]